VNQFKKTNPEPRRLHGAAATGIQWGFQEMEKDRINPELPARNQSARLEPIKIDPL